MLIGVSPFGSASDWLIGKRSTSSPSTEAINTYIADLRRKLEPDPGRPRLLKTVRGSGYRLAV